MDLFQQILSEMGEWCHTSTQRDFKTVSLRVEGEGLSFLTITLSNFGKDFEKSLDQGFVAHDQFKGFAFTGGLPRLFGGFLELVFDRNSGVLREDASVDAIQCVRQLTLMFAKMAIECSPARREAAIDKYLSCELEVKKADLAFESLHEEFDAMVSLLWSDMFANIDREIYEGNVIPKHGPGATADRLKGNQKFNQSSWTSRLEEVFPAGENLFASYHQYIDDYDRLVFHEPGAEVPVRVITVPKTLKTPRIIAIEPTAMQYMQQGVLEIFEKAMRGHDIPRNLIDYSSQVPNQDMARRGSLDGSLATLDLSEASDRVSNQHVRRMLRNFPSFAAAVDATRSRKADVDGRRIIRLSKFASMGSALCFPMEAVVFATVVFIGIQKGLGRRITKKDVKSLMGSVRVYGDDIVVPVEFVGSVVGSLEAFGFKVNSNKSFWTGKFRESCGKEYWSGDDVSIVKLRTMLPTQRKQASEIISTVAFANLLYKHGLWKTAAYVFDLVERIIPLPRVAETSSALGRRSFIGYDTDGWDSNLQRPFVKGMAVKVKLPESNLDGYGALMKAFLKRSDLPFADRNHLLLAGRPVSVDIKYRRICPF